MWRVIGTTAQEQLINCCFQVGAASGVSLILGEPGLGSHGCSKEELITCCPQVGAPSGVSPLLPKEPEVMDVKKGS